MRRPAFARWIALAGSALLALLLLELVLRLFPGLPGERLANYVWSRYGTFPGGIYAREPISQVHFMWPDFATETRWNGRTWHHATDPRGFRNPAGAPHDVLLLGDSLVYGHGVEEEATVTHVLRSELGIGAYNMGRQGACLLDEYVFARTFAEELAPREVVLAVFLNDFDDLGVYRTDAQIEEAPELGYDYRALRAWAAGLAARRPSALRRWSTTLPSLRLLRGLAKSLGPLTLTTPAWAAEAPDTPPFLIPLHSEERLRLLERYYRRLLGDLAERLDARGARLRLVYLSAGAWRATWAAEQETAVELVRRAAPEAALPLFDTRALFAGCDACFLPHDGHYSAEGHRRLARFLAAEVIGREN